MRRIWGVDDDGSPLTDDEVAAAYPWPDPPSSSTRDRRPWVRAMMVTTLDGAAAGPDGLSGSISSDADRTVFRAVRRFADAVLVGSGTLRAEEYGPMQAKPEDGERRGAAGQAAAPRLAVVSGSLRLPWELPVWAESTERPLVLTTEPADPADHEERAQWRARLAEAERHVVVAVLPSLEPADLLAALAERGLWRVVCEGGPTLLRDMVAAGAVDEADITVSPTFAGTSSTPTTDGLPDVAAFRLVHVLTRDEFLMLRYLRSDSDGAATPEGAGA